MAETKELQPREKQELSTPAEQTKPGLVFTPAVDIFETEKEITLLADIPGVGRLGQTCLVMLALRDPLLPFLLQIATCGFVNLHEMVHLPLPKGRTLVFRLIVHWLAWRMGNITHPIRHNFT